MASSIFNKDYQLIFKILRANESIHKEIRCFALCGFNVLINLVIHFSHQTWKDQTLVSWLSWSSNFWYRCLKSAWHDPHQVLIFRNQELICQSSTFPCLSGPGDRPGLGIESGMTAIVSMTWDRAHELWHESPTYIAHSSFLFTYQAKMA